MKKDILRFIVSSILAGMCIAIGGTVFLSLENKVIGASLFSIGLFFIVMRQLNLYTGKLINKIKQYNISINVTCYDFNREQTIRDFFNTYGIHATLYFKNFSGNFNNGCEFFNKFFTQNVIEDTGDCLSKYWCTQLKDQKLYVCQYLGYMNHFINKFGIEEAHKIGYDEKFAYLDLTKVNDYSEIEQYMNNYDENICKHCIDRWNCNDIKRRLKNWSTTKENISEWVIDDINNLKCELS